MKARVLHVITRLDLGGAQQNTLYCVSHHDRARFEVGPNPDEPGTQVTLTIPTAAKETE